jgi:hypothetical protein
MVDNVLKQNQSVFNLQHKSPEILDPEVAEKYNNTSLASD